MNEEKPKPNGAANEGSIAALHAADNAVAAPPSAPKGPPPMPQDPDAAAAPETHISIAGAASELWAAKPEPRKSPEAEEKAPDSGVKPKSADSGIVVRRRDRAAPSPEELTPTAAGEAIVSDKAAAAVHIQKKTVHPGEAPARTPEQDRKVRLATRIDPRRQPTQITERKKVSPWAAAGTLDKESLPSAHLPSAAAAPEKAPEKLPIKGIALIMGIAALAAAGAVLLGKSMSSDKPKDPGSPPPELSAVVLPMPPATIEPAPTASETAPPVASGTSTGTETPSDAPTGEPSATQGPTNTDAPPVSTGGTTGHFTGPTPTAKPTSKPTATATTPPTPTTKPSSTRIFGNDSD